MEDASEIPTARLGPSGILPRRPGSASGSLPRIQPTDTPLETPKSTARGSDDGEPRKIKWVPHTHPNPSHARFCYMCLHGALEGKEDLLQAREVDTSGDLPSVTEMRNRGYLNTKDHIRQSADFRRNNLVATWLRSMIKEVYGQNRNLLHELNAQIGREDPRSPVAGGGSWFLIYEHEEDSDAKMVKRLFQLLPKDQRHLDRMSELLKDYCFSKPLFTYNPAPEVLAEWCKVLVTKREKELLVFKPMADLAGLPSSTQKMISELEDEATKSGYLKFVSHCSN